MNTNCAVCPTCNRRFTTPRQTIDKKLAADLAKANAAITVLACGIHARNASESLWEACESERRRLERALTDHRLLWSIYRRSDKASGYGISIVKAAA